MRIAALFVCVVLLCQTLVFCQQTPTELFLIGLFAQSGGFGNPDQFEWLSASRVAVENINSDSTILPNTILSLIPQDTKTDEAVGVSAFLDQANDGIPRIGVIGPSSSRVCAAVSFPASWYEIPQVSYSCTSVSLSDKTKHPYFLRGVPPDDAQSTALAEIMVFFGFDQFDIGAISTADEYGGRGIEAFRDAAEELGIFISRVEQFLSGEKDVSTQVANLKDSGSRVFLSFMVGSDHNTVISEAVEQEIVGEFYVWFCADGCAATDSFFKTLDDGSRELDDAVFQGMLGTLGTTPAGGRGPLYDSLLEQWEQLDPVEYPGAGKDFMHPFAAVAYDVIWAYARAADAIINNGQSFSGNSMLESLKLVNFTGVTGQFNFDENGNRIPEYDLLNLPVDSQQFVSVGRWNPVFLEIQEDEITWPGGTNQKPDLDVRDPIDYWSCHDKREYTDETGKEVKLRKPDGDDVDFIDIDYHCDQYIDCHNMSDEGTDCGASIIPAMITFGIITGLLILIYFALSILIIILALCAKIERIVHSGPIYILTITFAALIGLISTYSFYGKPHKVSCGFQPWLLGPPIMLLISTLFVRAVTQFVALRSQYGVLKFGYLKFFGSIIILNTPFFIILIVWYIVSTPTAEFMEIDGEDDHYICTSGGLVPQLTWVFFFILVGYGGFILVLSAIFVFVTRSIKTKYNEAQTIALSIYNLVFVGIVSVPVLFVLQLQHSLLAYWILLNVVILYTFSSTMFFHYMPLFVGTIKDALFPKEDDHDTNIKARPDAEG